MRLINHCYEKAFDKSSELSKRIEYLHTIEMCRDYVTPHDCVIKSVDLWNELAYLVVQSDCKLTGKYLYMLLGIAKELEDISAISENLKMALQQRMKRVSESDSIDAMVYYRIVELRL